MKNSIKIFFVLLLAVGSISCMKSNPYEMYDGQAMLEKEAPQLKEYVETTEGLEDAKLDKETGIWYKIIEEGVQPGEDGFYKYKITNTGSNDARIEAPVITVKYAGKLVSNGVVFDKKEENTEFSLGGVIVGWQVGFLPITITDEQGKAHQTGGLTELGLQKGSKVRLVIPSPWGYQNSERQGIPANSPLDFTIEVIKLSSPIKPQ
jgi:FKBP-type peptidyl-prolyl cis-trans isomerase FkpA